MRKTTNYGLSLYDKEDKMSITAEENSLNANMELIDKTLKEKADNNNIPTKLSELDNDKNFITNEELENKGYLTDVPSEYITETELNNKGYLTEHQDLSDYAKTTDIPTKVSELENDSNYLNSIPLEYVTETDLTGKGYATESFVTNKIAEAELSGSDVDLSGLATKDELNSKVDKVKGKSLIDDTEIERLKNVTNYDDTEIRNELNDKANKSEIPSKVSELTNDSGYLTEHQDISNLATKGELNNKVDKVSGKSLVDDTEISRLKNVTNYDDTEIKNILDTKANTSAIPTKVSQLENDKNYLTSVPSEYVTETELNNKKYLTSVPSDYKTKTENDSLYQPKGNYLTSYTESDPTVPSHVKSIKTTDISNWNSKSEFSGNYNDLTNKPTKVSEFENDADYITNKTSVISERLPASVYGWKTGYYCNYNTGKIAGGVAHYSVTDYIEISPKWQKIKAYIRADGDLAGVGFYNSSKGFISGVQIPDTNDGFELFEYAIPEGAVYVCVSNRPETNVDSYIEVEWEADGLLTRMSEMEKQIESVSTQTNAISYGYVASNVLCIGDSLTAGAFYAGEANDLDIARGTAIAQNYPYFLSRMLDCRTTNAGTNGYSPSDWYSKYINKYTYEDYDTFIIWLGTNYGCNSMPTDAEISAFVPESSPTASTANQSLYLIKIIETIQKANTSCHIVLCSVFGSKSNKETHNGIVAQIASKYNCQLVDMSDLGYSNHPELHAGINDPHFGKAGNVFVANRLALAINDYIVSNPRTGDFGITTKPMPTLTASEKEEISQLLNEKGYLTNIPSEYVTETELSNKNYATNNELTELDNQKANKSTTLSGYGITDGATIEYVDKEIKKLSQLTPIFTDSIENCTDTDRVYVLPDGYIYAYQKIGGYNNLVTTSIDKDGSLFNSTGYIAGQTLNASDAGATTTEKSGVVATGYMPVKYKDVIRMSGTTWKNSSGSKIMFFDKNFMGVGGYQGNGYTIMSPTSVTGEANNKSVLQDKSLQSVSTVDGVVTFNLKFYDVDTGNNGWSGNRVAYMRISASGSGSDMVVTTNQEIIEESYSWVNTGVKYVDNEDYITREEFEEYRTSNSTLKGKKVMFFGDSITHNEAMYVGNLLERTGMNRVANFAINGATLNNYSDTVMDGAPAQSAGHNNTVPNQLQKLLNDVSSYETPDIVIVSAATNGGTAPADYDESQYTDENDAFIELSAVKLTSYSGAMRWIYETLIGLYPDAKIIFATPIQSYGGGSRTYKILSDKAECIRQNCQRLSTPCIDAFKKSGIYGRYEVQSANGKYLKDGLHPNSAGAVVLAKCYHRELLNLLID